MYFSCSSCKTRVDYPRDGSIEEVVCPGCDVAMPIANAMRHGVLEPGATLGGYEILSLIGVGGMGKVYEAIQVSLQRKVALKVIVASLAGSDVMAKRFLLEVRSTASLEHPSIVTVFEASEEGGLLYLAMELVNGKTLEEIIDATGGRLDEDQAWKYAEKVIKAMDYAWRYQKLLHRDIKPANVMVLDNGQVKICDLGIAKRPEDEYELSKEGMAIGTPFYMSPEQGQGRTDLDFRADVYSLGATLYHLITGKLPFPGNSAVDVITKHIVADLPHPKEAFPDISDGGGELLSLMMLKEPKMRHDSWNDLLLDVERVREGGLPAHVPQPSSADNQASGGADSGEFRQTILDMDAVEQELRRVGLASKQPTANGWVAVRIGLFVVLLFAAVGFVGYQFRNLLFPQAFADPSPNPRPTLLVDDGTPAAPAAARAIPSDTFIDQRTRYLEDVLKTV